MIDPITQYILEQQGAVGLPKDLIDFLIKKLYPMMHKGSYSIKHIEKEHNSNIKYIDQKDMISRLNLYGIFTYRNGDTAWYSFKDGKVYDYNHELDKFNSPSDKKLWPPAPYKQWMKDVLSEKHIDAWK